MLQPNLYCDMDGVLADLEKGYTLQTGIPWSTAEKLPKAIFWGHAYACSEFFYNLPMMEDAEELWNEIAFLNPIILTALPRKTSYPTAEDEKRRWIPKNLGDNIEVITVKSAKDKIRFYRPGSGDILIDDRADTIETWKKAGGIGIHHTSAFDTICQLREHGII